MSLKTKMNIALGHMAKEALEKTESLEENSNQVKKVADTIKTEINRKVDVAEMALPIDGSVPF